MSLFPFANLCCVRQISGASLVFQRVKNLPARRETSVRSLGQEDLLEKEGLPTPVFFPGKSHGQRSLAGYSPWDHKELDTTKATEHACNPIMKAPPS